MTEICRYVSHQKAGLHGWELLQSYTMSLFYLPNGQRCWLFALFSAHLEEWTGGLPAQLGWMQKRGSLCTYPVSLFIFFYIFNHFPYKSAFQNTREDTVCLLPTKSHYIVLVYLPVHLFILKHSKAKPSTKNRMLEVIACGTVLQTELLSNKVARNYLLLTGYCKHENNTYTSHFTLSNSLALTSLMRVFLKMLPASSMTTVSKLQETKNKVAMNHPPLQRFFFSWRDHRLWTRSCEMMTTPGSHKPDSYHTCCGSSGISSLGSGSSAQFCAKAQLLTLSTEGRFKPLFLLCYRRGK